MNKLKKIFLIIVVLFLSLIIYDVIFNYKEKFITQSISAQLYTIVDVNEDGCVELKEIQKESDVDSALLLGITLNLEYISEKHEWFSFLYNFPEGAEGNADIIDQISLKSGKNKLDYIYSLSSALKYKYFIIPDWIVDAHTVTSFEHGTCYKAQTYNSIKDFVSFYNNSSFKWNNRLLLEDTQFFIINNEERIPLPLELEIDFSDGKKIQSAIP